MNSPPEINAKRQPVVRLIRAFGTVTDHAFFDATPQPFSYQPSLPARLEPDPADPDGPCRADFGQRAPEMDFQLLSTRT